MPLGGSLSSCAPNNLRNFFPPLSSLFFSFLLRLLLLLHTFVFAFSHFARPPRLLLAFVRGVSPSDASKKRKLFTKQTKSKYAILGEFFASHFFARAPTFSVLLATENMFAFRGAIALVARRPNSREQITIDSSARGQQPNTQRP